MKDGDNYKDGVNYKDAAKDWVKDIVNDSVKDGVRHLVEVQRRGKVAGTLQMELY